MTPGSGDTGESKKVGPVKANGTGNVVRFPGNWFGSKDDLIPFGPSAERIHAERAARAAEISAPLTDRSEDEPGAGVSATDFWGGGSGVFHPPSTAGAPADPPAPPTPGRRGPFANQVGARTPDGWKLRLSGALPGFRRPVVRPHLDLTIFSAGLAALMVLGACLAFAFSHGGGSARPKQTASTKASAGHRSAGASGAGGSHAILQRSPVAVGPVRPLRLKHHRERAAPHQPARVHRRSPHRTAGDDAHSSGGGTPSTGSGVSASSSSSVDTGDEGSVGDVSASSGSGGGTSGSAGTSSAGDGGGGASSSTHGTGASSSQEATGPAGPGGTVGSGCNPVCQ